MASLQTRFVGLDLRSPIIAGSAGTTANADRMKRAEDHGAGAVELGDGVSSFSIEQTSGEHAIDSLADSSMKPIDDILDLRTIPGCD